MTTEGPRLGIFPVEDVLRGVCGRVPAKDGKVAFICGATVTRLNTSTEATEASFYCPRTSDECRFAKRETNTITNSGGGIVRVALKNSDN